MKSPVIDREEALVLLPALTTRAAERLGIRCLLIKGAVQAYHGLRDPRPSVDVDLLVDPADFRLLWREFESWGWTRVVMSHDPTGPTHHSATFRHPRWPIEIDLHHRFPGFLEESESVFESLWADRSRLELAATDVTITGWPGSVLIGALHHLRRGDPMSSAEWRQLVQAVSQTDAQRVESLRALARETGASQTVAPLFDLVGLSREPVPDAHRAGLTEWTMRASPDQMPSLTWLLELSSAPVRRWPQLVWRAVRGPDEAALRSRFPEAPAGRRGVWAMHARRWRKAVTALPRIVGRYLNVRRRI